MGREVDRGMASVMHYLKFALLTFQTGKRGKKRCLGMFVVELIPSF